MYVILVPPGGGIIERYAQCYCLALRTAAHAADCSILTMRNSVTEPIIIEIWLKFNECFVISLPLLLHEMLPHSVF